jgi:hypothetical protein
MKSNGMWSSKERQSSCGFCNYVHINLVGEGEAIKSLLGHDGDIVYNYGYKNTILENIV